MKRTMEADFKQERTRVYDDQKKDDYKWEKKLPEPTVCPDCEALFVNGRWTWEKEPEPVHKELCPACRRIRDNYPAGVIVIRGHFFEQHKSEILNLISNTEEAETSEHPVERIMRVDEEDGATIITTTGFHLPKRVGDALRKAYKGVLEVSFEAEDRVHVTWSREI